MATIGQRISDLIGSSYDTIPSNSKKDLINAACNEVIDMLSNAILLKYSTQKVELTSNSFDTPENDRILRVGREIDATANARVVDCKIVPVEEYDRCTEEGSIYEATKYSPIFSYADDGSSGSKIKIFPEPTNDERGHVWYISYLTISTDVAGLTDIPSIPKTAEQAIVLKSSVNILQAYISDFVQDEEDSELQQMITAQQAQLMAQFQGEMSRWVNQEEQPKGE